MEELDIKDKILQIEDCSGNTIMLITVNEQGCIIGCDNCEIADTEDNRVRLQMIRDLY